MCTLFQKDCSFLQDAHFIDYFMNTSNFIAAISYFLTVRSLKCVKIQDELAKKYGYLQTACIKYEDLIRNPLQSLKALFDYCGLPKALVVQALSGLENDSQTNSPIAKAKVTQHAEVFEMNDQLMEEFALLAKILELPSHFDELLLPNTITHASK